MVDRKKFDHALAMRQQLEAHYPDRNFQDAFQLSEELRDHFEIKLLVVGHFSAGKSALLNALLQRPAFLKEAQQPQTALATELVYDTTEQAFAYRKDGSCEELQAGKEYLPEEYSHLEYHVNAPALARIADYTIVDTPGFDSGIEAHAQALSNYIGVGSAYLVVVDQEKGGLDETTLQFIREISHYSNQIAVVLNKCDKITPDTVEQIVSAAQGTLEMWGFPYKVYPISLCPGRGLLYPAGIHSRTVPCTESLRPYHDPAAAHRSGKHRKTVADRAAQTQSGHPRFGRKPPQF